MKIRRRAFSNSWFVVFHNSSISWKWEWFFSGLLGLSTASYGQYENAYGPVTLGSILRLLSSIALLVAGIYLAVSGLMGRL